MTEPSSPSSAVAPPADIGAWLAAAGLVTLTPTGGPPSVVGWFAGGPVPGSWWAHPLGGAMYALGARLDAHPDAWAMRLVDGRTTWVHRALWAPLLRVVGDEAWRAPRVAALDTMAAGLLGEVEVAGRLPVGRASRKAREKLEGWLLAHGSSAHGEGGTHRASLRTWAVSAADAGVSMDAVAAWEYPEALAAVVAACKGRRVGAAGPR